MFTMDCYFGSLPKRGDLLQTNVGNRRERTWFIIQARRIKRKEPAVPRYALSVVRWWEIRPETRRRLFKSAERAGGQNVFLFKPYLVKKKRQTFEDYMRRHRTNGNLNASL